MNCSVELLKTTISDHFTVKWETNCVLDAAEESRLPRKARNILRKGFFAYNMKKV